MIMIPKHFYVNSDVLSKIKEAVEQEPNNMSLGAKVRIIIDDLKSGKYDQNSYTIELDESFDSEEQHY